MNSFFNSAFEPVLDEMHHHILAYILIFAVGTYSYSWGYMSGCKRYEKYICIIMVTLMDLLGCIGIHMLMVH